jgi:hypothetical protein
VRAEHLGQTVTILNLTTMLTLEIGITKKPALQANIDVLRARKKKLSLLLRQLGLELRLAEKIMPDKLNSYASLNEELRKVKIFEAELVFLRNSI